ncbi:MAG: EAL domain-containing protein, partial [Pseudomonadales bacterium]
TQTHLYRVDAKLYQLSLSPVKIGSKRLGWVGFGYVIDRDLAQRYKDITGLETSFVLREDKQWNMIASSAPDATLGFARKILRGDYPDQYIAQSQLISGGENFQFGVTMYGLREDLVEVLQKQWLQLLFIILVTLVLSLGGAYWIAASITRPITRLVEQAKMVASGDYHKMIDLRDQSELGQLASEFNAMQSAVLIRERAIEHRANHDSLTDLPNRHMLLHQLQEMAQTDTCFSIFHLNLSRLKDVNDTLGHDVGDEIIVEAATRLSKIVGFRRVYHTGSDEFILLSNQQDECNHTELVEALERAFEPLFHYQSFCFQLQARTGVAKYPEHSTDTNALLQMADTALHYTKKNRQSTQVYSPEFDNNTVERLSLINDFKNAVAQDQLELHYQPKMDLTSRKITHAEALVRWRHPQLGMIPPDNFIPIAEQTGQINELTRWVINTAVAQHNTWLEIGLDINIAVNISAEDLGDPDFFNYVCNATREAGVAPQKITLEVTESAVVDDPESAIKLLQKFKDLGFYLSIDDYGTGYSSLAQLKHLPVSELKIDKSFVQRLQEDLDDRIIVRSTIELAHSMGLTVVAEGIEDDFALDWLAQHGCEKAQGYFISRPQQSEPLTQWLLEQREKTHQLNCE